MATDVLALIDGALRDYGTSSDAMRWAPPGAEIGERPAPQCQVTIAFDARAFIDALNGVLEAVGRLIASQGVALGSVAGLSAALAEAGTWQQARISAMHREYRRRQKARQRRRRA